MLSRPFGETKNLRVHENKVNTGQGLANFISSYVMEIGDLEKRKLTHMGEEKS